MKKFILLLFLTFLNYSFLFAQKITSKDTIYIDEFKTFIEKDLALKKCKSNTFYCRVKEYDSIVTYNVYYKYFFGKLKKTEYIQYLSILKNRISVQIDTNSVIVINYKKTLDSYNNYINILDSLNRISSKINEERKIKSVNERAFKSYNKQYIKKQKHCLKKIKKIDNITSIYLYSIKNDRKKNVGVFEWRRDYNKTFMKRFFGKESKFNLLILRPDGSFFLKSKKASYHDFSEDDVFDLLKNNDWNGFLNEWDFRLKKLSKSIPIIRLYIDYYTPRLNCF